MKDIWLHLIPRIENLVTIRRLSETCRYFKELVHILHSVRYENALRLRKEGLNMGEAPRLLLEAAQCGNTHAMFHIGYSHFYEGGWGLNTERVLAEDWFRKAAHGGNSHAMSFYALCIRKSNATVEQCQRAVLWVKKAQRTPGSDFAVAFAHYHDFYSPGLRPIALSLFLRAAEQQNDEFAQFYAAFCFNIGIGTEVSYDKAIQWYSKAAESGLANAQYYLARLYRNSRHSENFVYWCTKAAAQGSKDAKSALSAAVAKKSN
jgi:TPR repeat protein